MIWVVATTERYLKTPEYYDPEDVAGAMSAMSERRAVCITFGEDREAAKRKAHPELGGNPDRYIVEPLTQEGDRVIFKLELLGA